MGFLGDLFGGSTKVYDPNKWLQPYYKGMIDPWMQFYGQALPQAWANWAGIAGVPMDFSWMQPGAQGGVTGQIPDMGGIMGMMSGLFGGQQGAAGTPFQWTQPQIPTQPTYSVDFEQIGIPSVPSMEQLGIRQNPEWMRAMYGYGTEQIQRAFQPMAKQALSGLERRGGGTAPSWTGDIMGNIAGQAGRSRADLYARGQQEQWNRQQWGQQYRQQAQALRQQAQQAQAQAQIQAQQAAWEQQYRQWLAQMQAWQQLMGTAYAPFQMMGSMQSGGAQAYHEPGVLDWLGGLAPFL